jgi:hypothetical protein
VRGEIAIAASTPTRGRVGFAVTEELGEVARTNYEWLEVRVPRVDSIPHPQIANSLAWVARAREACVVWHMMSCYEGFGGHETASFWKRLVDNVCHPHECVGSTCRVTQ